MNIDFDELFDFEEKSSIYEKERLTKGLHQKSSSTVSFPLEQQSSHQKIHSSFGIGTPPSVSSSSSNEQGMI